MTPVEPGEAVVDARGHRCPVPTLRLRRALDQAADGGCVTLLADDPMARIDVPHFAARAGHEMVDTVETPTGCLHFRIRKSSSGAVAGRGSRSG